MFRMPQSKAGQEIGEALQQTETQHPGLKMHQALNFRRDKQPRKRERGGEDGWHDRNDQGAAI